MLVLPTLMVLPKVLMVCMSMLKSFNQASKLSSKIVLILIIFTASSRKHFWLFFCASVIKLEFLLLLLTLFTLPRQHVIAWLLNFSGIGYTEKFWSQNSVKKSSEFLLQSFNRRSKTLIPEFRRACNSFLCWTVIFSWQFHKKLFGVVASILCVDSQWSNFPGVVYQSEAAHKFDKFVKWIAARGRFVTSNFHRAIEIALVFGR